MIEPIDKKAPQSSFDRLWFDEKLENCRVFLDKEITPPKPIISIGKHLYKGEYKDTIVMTKGSISVISAPSKSKKSFFKSQLCASYIGGQSTNFFPSIKSHRKTEELIIDIDTEQSAYYAQRTFKRVEYIVGGPYSKYFAFQVVELSVEERIIFIEKILKKYREELALVFIDGIADLVNDVNNLEQSTQIANILLKWANQYNIHICTIIHNVYGARKPTGHLGSAIVKKAESVFSLIPDENNSNIIEVEHLYARGRPFDNFKFVLNENDAMIYELDFKDEIASTTNYTNNPPISTEVKPPEKPLPKVSIKDAFEENTLPF